MIRARKTTIQALEALKVYPRETYDDVIARLIEREQREQATTQAS